MITPSTTTSEQDQLKRQVAEAAAALTLAHLPSGSILGVGTGSTVDVYIDALVAAMSQRPGWQLAGAVSSSDRTTKRLRSVGIAVIELNEVFTSEVFASHKLEQTTQPLALYVDGADEVDASGALIKGGGGALTREKILAQASERFVCVVDHSKCVSQLGHFPLPVEVLPMATGLVTAALRGLGATVTQRDSRTDNDCCILDAHGLRINRPDELEVTINQWPGVVCNGLFAQRRPDCLLVAGPQGVVQSGVLESYDLANK